MIVKFRFLFFLHEMVIWDSVLYSGVGVVGMDCSFEEAATILVRGCYTFKLETCCARLVCSEDMTEEVTLRGSCRYV